MKHYVHLILGMILCLLLLFGLAQLIGPPILTDPTPWFEQGRLGAAFVGTTLLLVDILLPVPSSLIMMANGAYFGVLPGMGLSMIGSVGAAILGYWLGRSSANIINRFIPQEEQLKANALLKQWGGLAIIVTRPVPVMAETVSIIAGISDMRFPQFLLTSIIGTLPAALLYAITGATAANLDSGIFIFILVLFIAGLFWIAGTKLGKHFLVFD